MTCYLLSGPASEPVTLDEARAFVRMDDTAEDALLTSLITAARLHIEGVTGRALVSESWRLVLDCWPPTRQVQLPVAPLASLTAITAHAADGSSTALALDEVQLAGGDNPAALFLPTGFGDGIILRERQGIDIDYVAGYGDDPADVPAALRQAALLLVGYWFENRDSPVISEGGSSVPTALDLLLAPYKAVRL